MTTPEIFLHVHILGTALHLLTVSLTVEHFVSCMRQHKRCKDNGVRYDRKLVAMDGSPFGYDIYVWPTWLFTSIVPVLNWLVLVSWCIWYCRRYCRMRRKETNEKTAFESFMKEATGATRDPKRPLKEFRVTCDQTPKKK